MSWGKYRKVQTFSVLIEKKVTNIVKDSNEGVVTISCKIKFLDSARFMATSSSNLVDNLTEGIYEIKCKQCDWSLHNESAKDNLIKYKCLSCNKVTQTKFMKNLKRDSRTNNDINKFILLLRKGVYLYEYMEL